MSQLFKKYQIICNITKCKKTNLTFELKYKVITDAQRCP